MGATGDTADPNFMQSLARGLEVLRAFEGQPSLSMAEAARISGLNRPSTGRCLFTLVRLGYVRERGGRYMLTPGLLPLACGFLTSTPLASASQAIANALRARLQETFSVGALDPADPGRIIFIAPAERNRVIAAPLWAGSPLPSHFTSMGRILLSALRADLRDEWSSHQGLEPRPNTTT